MNTVLVDANVLLDILAEDSHWLDWSSQNLEAAADRGRVVINPIVYAEISVRFSRIEDLEKALPKYFFDKEPLPFEAAFLAGKVFVEYRRQGGVKTSTLPDFLIGAHAVVKGNKILTRDTRHYRTYFPRVPLIAPTTA